MRYISRQTNQTAVKTVTTIRRMLGLSQRDLAQKLAITQGCVSQYERGDIVVSPAVAISLVDLAAAAGIQVTLDQVYGRQPLPEPSQASG
jgi:transcriptional regulator with XRE-family HTH domain